MPSKILKTLGQFDFFGVNPVLSYKGGSKSKSWFGSLCSYFMLVYIMLAAFYSFAGMIQKNVPNVVNSVTQGLQKGLPFGEKGINVGLFFAQSGPFGIVEDPTIYNYTIQYEKAKINPADGQLEGFTSSNIPHENCTKEHFSNVFAEDGFCLKRGEDITIGTFNSEYLKYRIRRCVNGTGSVVCKSDAEIDTFFAQRILVLYYQTYYLTPENYENPYRVERGVNFFKSTKGISKSIYVDLVETEIQTDSGFMTENVATEKFVSVENVYTDVALDGINEIDVLIKLTGQKRVLKRSYPKLQQALAGTVALARVGFLLCGFVIVPCTKIQFFKQVIDDLYNMNNKSNRSFKKLSFKAPQFRMNDAAQQQYQNLSINTSQISQVSDGGQETTTKQGSPNNLLQKAILQNQRQDSGGIGNQTDLKSEEAYAEQSKRDSTDSGSQNIPINGNDDLQKIEVNVPDNSEPFHTSGPLNPAEDEDDDDGKNQPNKKDERFSLTASSFSLWIRTHFRNLNSQRSELFSIGQQHVKDYLSITNLVEKLREIDRLKMLLLTSQQQNLFDHIPQPPIEKVVKGRNMKSLEEDYSALIAKPGKSALDQRLLELFVYGRVKK